MFALRTIRVGARPNVRAIGLLQISSRIATPRKFSSIPNRSHFSSIRWPLSSPYVARQSAILPLLPLSAVRFNSSASTPKPSPEATVPEFEPFDPVTSLDLTALNEAQKAITEHIGFLHELGLNFGFGPTSLMGWLLEHVHVYSGTPWFLSIIITTALFRLIQLPGYIKVSDTTAKVTELQPILAPLMKEFTEAQKNQDMLAVRRLQSEINAIYRRAKIKRIWLVFPLFNIPIFYGVYNLLRRMSDLPVPGFVTGGALWFPDLSVMDPYLIFPTITSLALGALAFIGGEAGTSQMSSRMRLFMGVGLPLISFAFMWKWPVAMTIYFATNALMGLLQSFVLRNPKCREFLGIYPLPTSPPPPKSLDAMNVISPALDASSNAKVTSSSQTPFMGTLTKNVKALMDKRDGVVIDPRWSPTAWKESLEEGAKRTKLESYESKRREEEARRRKQLILEKKKGRGDTEL